MKRILIALLIVALTSVSALSADFTISWDCPQNVDYYTVELYRVDYEKSAKEHRLVLELVESRDAGASPPFRWEGAPDNEDLVFGVTACSNGGCMSQIKSVILYRGAASVAMPSAPASGCSME